MRSKELSRVSLQQKRLLKKTVLMDSYFQYYYEYWM